MKPTCQIPALVGYELIRTKRVQHSSMGFIAMSDEFRHQGSTVVRHLMSIRLMECSPVAQPGYFDTSAAVRSLAAQVDEDPQDVEALAAQGELRTLFQRTDLQVSAPVSVPPTPLAVAQRSEPSPEMMRRENSLTRRKLDMDGPRTLSNEMARAQLDLTKKRMDWEQRGELIEARSLTTQQEDFPRDQHGNAVDWPPARR
jgi:hypothetical protein